MKTISLYLLLSLLFGFSPAFAVAIGTPTPSSALQPAPKVNNNSKTYLLWRAAFYEQRINEETAAYNEHTKMLARYQKEYDDLSNEKPEWSSGPYKHPDRLSLMQRLKHILVHCNVITKDSEALIGNYRVDVKWYRQKAAEATEP